MIDLSKFSLYKPVILILINFLQIFYGLRIVSNLSAGFSNPPFQPYVPVIFERIKYFYDAGLWSKPMVKVAVRKGIITKQQYEEITGEVYESETVYRFFTEGV